jgi:hypothetical protein
MNEAEGTAATNGDGSARRREMPWPRRQGPMWSGLMSGRGSSRGGSALPRSSVRTGFGGGARPGILSLNLRPSLVVSSLGLGSSGSPGIGLMDPGYSSCRRRLLRPLSGRDQLVVGVGARGSDGVWSRRREHRVCRSGRSRSRSSSEAAGQAWGYCQTYSAAAFGRPASRLPRFRTKRAGSCTVCRLPPRSSTMASARRSAAEAS